MAISKLDSVLVLESRHPKHIQFSTYSMKEKDFKSLFFDAVSAVSGDQAVVGTLVEKSLTSPNAIDAHDVTIAMARANMSLSITKSIADRVVKAYQEIINMR